MKNAEGLPCPRSRMYSFMVPFDPNDLLARAYRISEVVVYRGHAIVV